MSAVHHLKLPSGLSFHYLGPPLKEGPLPTLFYLTLAADDSLIVDPYNQPVVPIAHLPMRIFSVNLPAHGPGLSPLEALSVWAQDVTVLVDFIDKMAESLKHMLSEGMLDPERLAIAGLSRGAFFATHIAAKVPQVKTVLGFAPLIHLSYTKEFLHLQQDPLVHSLNLNLLIDKLIGKTFRFYIGNRDTRVGTELCFRFIEALAEANFQSKFRSPPVEMIITPSIGFQGHGTSQDSFVNGAAWVGKELGVIHGA